MLLVPWPLLWPLRWLWSAAGEQGLQGERPGCPRCSDLSVCVTRHLLHLLRSDFFISEKKDIHAIKVIIIKLHTPCRIVIRVKGHVFRLPHG